MSAVLQQTQQWLELRKTKIGASDAPIIMGMSPWKTPYQLWLEKMGISAGAQQTAAMRRGLDLEDKCRLHFFLETGIKITPEVMLSQEYNWMMASLDGISEDRKTIVEIKCPGDYDHNLAKKGEIPKKYVPQLQHQMVVCDVDKAYYYSYDGTAGVLLCVDRDERMIKEMIEKEEIFFDCMETFKAPALSDKDVQHRDDALWLSVCEKYRTIEDQIEAYSEEKEKIREYLISLCEGKNCHGGGVNVSRVIRKGNVNYSKIPELEGVDLDAYRAPATEMWRINTKEC